MPARFDVDHERRLVTITQVGPWSVDQLLNEVEQLDPRAVEYAIVVDTRLVEPGLSGRDVLRVVSRLSLLKRIRMRGPIAIVATQPVVFGTARMFATHAESIGLRVSVFRTFEEADAWLSKQNNPAVAKQERE
jgi:hypothetical protein